MTTRTREDLVADMERFATSLPGVMAADAQVALIVPGNLTDEETQRVAAAVPEGARISVFTDATRAGWSNGKKIVWGQNDGGLHDWRRATTVGDGPVATFTVSMHDVLDAWRSKYVVYNEDGDGHYTDTPDTVEEAIIIAAANQLAMSVKGEYIKTIVGETQCEHTEWVPEIESWVRCTANTLMHTPDTRVLCPAHCGCGNIDLGESGAA